MHKRLWPDGDLSEMENMWHIRGGLFNDTTKTAMVAAGMLFGRTTHNADEVLMVSYPSELKSWSTATSITTLTAMKANVDNAFVRGEIAQFHFHDLVASGPTGEDISIADFQSFIDYVKASGLPCLTINDLYNLQNGPISIPI